MTTTKIKVPSSLRRKFKVIANQLPFVELRNDAGEVVMYRRGFTGDQLISYGKTEVGNAPVDPKGHYSAMVPQGVDHYENLCRAYEQDGQAGIQKYVNQYIKIETPKESTPQGSCLT